jgi:hypothetical protein
MTTKKKADEEAYRTIEYSLVPIAQDLSTTDPYVEDQDLDHGDLLVPTLQLLQGMSEPVKQGLAGARPGLFWDPYRQEPIQGPMEGVVVYFTKTRFMRADDKANREQCQSFDNVNGTTYGECEICVFSKWGCDAQEKVNWQAPPCSLNYTFILATPNGPLALRFRKKAEKAARTFLTQKTMSRKNWWSHPVHIDSKQETGVDASGRPAQYFVPTIVWILEKQLDDGLRSYAKNLHDGLAAAKEAGRFRTEEVEDAAE